MSVIVNQLDVEKWGCPHCGYRSFAIPISGGGVGMCRCGDCGNGFVMLHEDLTEIPEMYIELKGQKVQKHPREGTPKHGRSDTKPEGGGEFFNPRGIGSDNTPGCFVCGGRTGLYSNIAAYVRCKDAGERVVAMFGQGARLDYREHEPDYVQVKLGACSDHLSNLRALKKLTEDGIITPEIIQNAKDHPVMEVEIYRLWDDKTWDTSYVTIPSDTPDDKVEEVARQEAFALVEKYQPSYAPTLCGCGLHHFSREGVL